MTRSDLPALRHLRCPHCGGTLRQIVRQLRCPEGHGFDIARQGYVSLLRGDEHTGSADTAPMVDARERFLDGGHLDPLRDVLATHVASVAMGDGCLLDVGAGTGHHAADALERMPRHRGLAVDISKPALRRAARAHPRLAAIGCDVWGPLPITDRSVAVALDVFAPRRGAELRRVLRPGAALVVVSPTGDHLAELVRPLGLLTVDPDKHRRLTEGLGPHLELSDRWRHRHTIRLDRSDAETAVAMGPSARHLDPGSIRTGLATLPDPLTATVSVEVSTWRRRGGPGG